MRGRTSSSVASAKTSSGAIRELADARAARALALGRHPHARGPMARGDQRQLDRARVLDAPEHERAVDLLDAVLGESARAAAPSSARRVANSSAPEVSTSSRCTTPLRSPPSPTPCTSGCARDHARSARVPRLVLARADAPARRRACRPRASRAPARSTAQLRLGLGDRALLLAPRERRDRDATPG